MAASLSTNFQTFLPAPGPATPLKCQASPLDCLQEAENCLPDTPCLSLSTSGSDENSDHEPASDSESREGGDRNYTQGGDNCMKQAPDPSPLCNYGELNRMEEQIWHATEQYLQALRWKLPNTSFEGMLEAMETAQLAYPGDSKDPHWASLALLLHALRVSSLLPISARPSSAKCKKSRRKGHLKSKRTAAKSLQKAEIQSIPTKKNGEPKAKTGRKPQNHECFVCSAVLPYKFQLIQHFQVCHDVQKSQSLLYKRVNQSPEAMRRLYGL